MNFDPFGLVGSTISGRYVVEEVVGEGGFSVVYRARHILWNRPVAIKAFRGLTQLEPDAQARLLQAFVQEGAILAELSERSTAIVQARDTATLVTSEGEWVPYLVLEWLPGETLETVLWRERQAGVPPRTLDEALALLEPIARALAMAHEKGICHRDLKPGNLLLLDDARSSFPESSVIKLLDFGTASLATDERRALRAEARTRDASGFTPSYGAPEQFVPAYGATGPWTDVFALALILVELVGGREPLGDGSSVDAAAAVAIDPARRPTPRTLGVDVSDAIEAVFARALAVSPGDRWPSVRAFWCALREAIDAVDGEPLLLRPTAARRPSQPDPAVAPASEQPIRAPRAPVAARDRGPRITPAAAVALAVALAASVISDHRVLFSHSASSVSHPPSSAVELSKRGRAARVAPPG